MNSIKYLSLVVRDILITFNDVFPLDKRYDKYTGKEKSKEYSEPGYMTFVNE